MKPYILPGEGGEEKVMTYNLRWKYLASQVYHRKTQGDAVYRESEVSISYDDILFCGLCDLNSREFDAHNRFAQIRPSIRPFVRPRGGYRGSQGR